MPEMKCPKCGEKLFAPDDTPGEEVRCQSCGASVAMTATGVETPNVPITPPIDYDNSQVQNPYESPSAFAGEEFLNVGPAELGSGEIARAMRGTRPWVLFLSILGFIGSAFMIFTTLIMLVTTLLTITGTPMGPSPPGMGRIDLILILFFHANGAIFSVAFSYRMLMYANRIGDFLRDPTSVRLGAALVAQKSFWKLLGIVAAAYLVIATLMVVGIIWL